MAKKNSDVIDIQIGGIKKKRFRIDKDDSKIIELDTTDINLVKRFEESIPIITQIMEERENLGDIPEVDKNSSTEEAMEIVNKITSALDKMEQKLRKQIDYIFDSNICEIICGNSSIFTPVDGSLRYERIILALIPLYENGLNEEAEKVQERLKKSTDKYTRG